jgi:hypothetical protein
VTHECWHYQNSQRRCMLCKKEVTMTIQRYTAQRGSPSEGVSWKKDPAGNVILRRDMVKLLRDLRADVTTPDPNNRQPEDARREGYIAALEAVLRQLD